MEDFEIELQINQLARAMVKSGFSIDKAEETLLDVVRTIAQELRDGE